MNNSQGNKEIELLKCLPGAELVVALVVEVAVEEAAIIYETTIMT